MCFEQSARFDRLDSRFQHIITALLDHRNTNPTDLREQMMAVTQLLNRTERVLASQHEITRTTIIDAIRRAGVSDNVVRDVNMEPEEILVTSMRTDEMKLKFDVEAGILETLRFAKMSTRYEEVTEAHRSTFEWLFRGDIDGTQTQRWDSFTKWLRSGDSIYWVNGKAGSGKSTLMRYIYDHPSTQHQLRAWAGQTQLSIAGFFFWNSGSSEQRSQLGLLRSLLFRILQQYQELIPVVFPWLWARRYSQALDPFNHHEWEALSLTKLMQAFEILLQQTTVSMKLCLFIDGLDEYDGDHSNIADLFKKIAGSSNVKVCLSSRPLIEFEDAFSMFPSLRLQDLTLRDIRNYVSDNLMTNERYQRLSLQEPVQAPALVEEIVTKADGVFLWVKLVVRSLLSGLGKQDDISDLQKRLRLLPSDLETLYQHMLALIDPVYLDRASMMFQILRKAQDLDETLTVLAFAFAYDPTSTEWATPASTHHWTWNKLSNYCQKMEDRMKVQCMGLLEVSGVDPNALGSFGKINHKVQYLHRTARDYLEKSAVWGLLISYTAQLDFDPCFCLLRSCVLQMKTVPESTPLGVRQADLLTNCGYSAMLYASGIKYGFSYDYLSLLDQLEQVWGKGSLLRHAISYDLVSFVNKELATSRTLGQPLLHHAISPHSIRGGDPSSSTMVLTSKEMVEVLFQHGAKPSAQYGPSIVGGKNTAWKSLLSQIRDDRERDSLTIQYEIVKVFLKYGADPSEVVGRTQTAAEIIRQALDKYSPHDALEILEMLNHRSKRPWTPLLNRFTSWSSRRSASKSR